MTARALFQLHTTLYVSAYNSRRKYLYEPGNQL